MKAHHFAATLALVLAASAGSAGAQETTRVFRQGGSTATITQDGPGSATVRRSVTGPSGQTIVMRQQGGGSAAIVQGGAGAVPRDEAPCGAGPQEPPCGPDLEMPRARPAPGGLFDWALPRTKAQDPAAEGPASEEETDAAAPAMDEAPVSGAERRISREFGMDLNVSDSFRSRFLDRMSVR